LFNHAKLLIKGKRCLNLHQIEKGGQPASNEETGETGKEGKIEHVRREPNQYW
jgi:hypothetical protein